MKADKRRVSQGVKEGEAAGVWLSTRASDVLLKAFTNRPMQKQSASSEQWVAAWDLLRSSLGVMADDPEIAAALTELDEAHGDALVEHEDRAWHAAWTAAMALK